MHGIGSCPRCGQPLPVERAGVRLTEHKARIFDAIRRAGSDGIDADVLFSIIYGERLEKVSRRTLKAHIWQLNDLLEETDLVVRGTRGSGRRYTLCRRKYETASRSERLTPQARC